MIVRRTQLVQHASITRSTSLDGACPPTAAATACGPRRTRRSGTCRGGSRNARRRSDAGAARVKCTLVAMPRSRRAAARSSRDQPHRSRSTSTVKSGARAWSPALGRRRPRQRQIREARRRSAARAPARCAWSSSKRASCCRPIAACRSIMLYLKPGFDHLVVRRPGAGVARPRIARSCRAATAIAHATGPRLRVGRHHAAFAGRQVLHRVEAERGEIAERADARAADRRAEGVRGILDQARGRARAASARNAAIATGRPAKCTGRSAAVRGVIAAAAADGSRFIVARSMSAKTGVAPVCMMALSVAQNVSGVVTTSSPGRRRRRAATGAARRCPS